MFIASCNADVTMCREYKLACLNWCCQLVPCFHCKLNLVCWWKKCSSCQHEATWGHEIRCLVIQKLNHLAISVCWCTVLVEHVKSQLSPQTRKCDCFAHFFVATNVKLQEFVINEPDFWLPKQDSNWQHQLRPASLYPWHIMTSVLSHD